MLSQLDRIFVRQLRSITAMLTFVLTLLIQTTLAQERTASTQPNVLLICVDDLKPLIGCFGDPHAKTPNIDRLAARSVRFDRAYCNQAVCSPSRNALMTSLRPQTLGIYDLPTNFRIARPDALTMAQHFRNHGYKAFAMGKIFHVGQGNHEDAASWNDTPFKPKVKTYAIASNEPKPDAKPSPARPNKDPRGSSTESADVSDETYGDGLIAAEAVRRIREARNAQSPVFLAVGFLKPHLPFVAPKKYWDMHDPSTLPQPERMTPPDGAPEYAPQFGGELRAYSDIPLNEKPLNPELTRHLIHGYYAAASYMDAQLGKVLDALNENGLAKNTIIVFWGDHGWHLGDHGIWCKHTNYEQATHIPLLVSVPAAKGSSTSALVETVDVYPTLCDLAGLPTPEGLDGRSFASVVNDPSKSHRDHAIHVYPRGQRLGRAVRTERYRLVEWKTFGKTEPDAFELYDYVEDPAETRNLAETHPDVVNNLRSLLAQHPDAKPQVKAPDDAKKAGAKTGKRKQAAKQKN